MAFRAFVAVPLPREEALVAALDEVRRTGADLKVAGPEELHMTLAFLGDVPDDAAPALSNALDGAVAGERAFGLELHGLGAFPNARAPRVVWAGARPSPALDELARRVRAACAQVGHPGDDKPFRAHATLARVRSDRGGAALARLLRERQDAPLPTIRVEVVKLYRSTLAPGGARHDPLHDARLEA